MKKKKITPSHAVFRMIMISVYSILSLAATLKYAWNDGDNEMGKISLVLLLIAVAFGVVNCAFGIYTLFNKDRMKSGDEYTVKIIHKAGHIAFTTVLLLIAAMFIVIQGFMIANIGNGIPLKDLIDIRIILCVVAGISLVSSFVFSLTLLIFSKRGMKDELQ